MTQPANAQSRSLHGPHVDFETKRSRASSTRREREDRQPLPALFAGAVIDHYELIRKLGSGGMGLVFLARDVRLGRLVAIKFLLSETGVALDRFVIEARATASCRHENIVIIHDVGAVAGFPYLVLEYIQGRTLREWMQDVISNRALAAIEVMVPVARALACAHAMGIIHRDLKPENILISDASQVKVVDFGVAKHIVDVELQSNGISSSKHPSRRLTDDDAIVGTTDYMSPEQWLGEPIDARADIWAMGVILFELATGVHPMELLMSEDLGDVSMLDVPMPSARMQLPKHSELAAIIDKCLKKPIDERFGSARELLDELERLQRQEKNLETFAEGESPFAGLSAFQESEAERFFGRDDDIAAVIARLRQEPLVAIAGPSGAGKSSFVRAGVIPVLKRIHRDWEFFVVRPGRNALASLADLLSSLDPAQAENQSDRALLVEIIRAQPGYFGAQLRTRCKKYGIDHHIVLFVDQFEELYTQGTTAPDRAAFGASLEAAADDASSPLRVIVTIRSDFLDRVAEERRYLAVITRALVLLPSMTADGLRQALEKPLELAGYRFEDNHLVAEMLDGLVGMKTPLPLLQFMATKLWQARDRERRLLTREAYDSLGGATGALSTHADAVLAAMTKREQRLVRSLFLRLVTPEKTRMALHWDELLRISEHESVVEQVTQHLADARLILIEPGRDGDRTVELVHESLIEGWTTLRQWLKVNENDAQFLADLRNAASQWENNGRIDDFLWRDRAAEDAGRWYAHHREHTTDDRTSALGSREADYLNAVGRFAERTRRKRKQAVSRVIALLCGVICVVSFFGLRARSEAKRADAKAMEAARSAEEAKQSAIEARNATFMAAANAHRSDATLVLALLREVEPTAPLPHQWKDLAQWTLRQQIARVVLPHDEPAQWASFSPDGSRIATVSWDRKVRVWNADGSGEPLVFEGHTDQVHTAVFSSDGKRIVTASSDKTARVWNADGKGKPVVLDGHQGPVNSAAFSPDGRRIVTGSSDKTVRISNADGSDKPIVLEGHHDVVSSVAFSPDGRRIVSASDDGTARVWNGDGQDEPIVLSGHRDRVHSAAFSPDGRRVVTASFDNTARVWNADASSTPIVLEGHVNSVRSAVFSPDGRHIATASWDRTVRLWNSDGQGEPLTIEGHQDKLCSASFSPDGLQIVTASLDKSVRVWDTDRRDKPRRLGGHEGTILSAAFSPDGSHIATAGMDSTARVWDAERIRAPLVLRGHVGKVGSVSFSPDGRRMVTASQDKTARVWDAKEGATLHVLRGHDAAVWSAAFSPDGRRIVTGSWDKTIRVWNADGQGEPLVLRGHDASINSAMFSPDGRYILSASEDTTVRIWNAGGEGEPRVLRNHGASVYSATYSPDGRRIITASWDKMVRIWDADSNSLLRVFEHGAAVGTGSIGGMGAFSPNGDRFVTIADDKTLHIWNSNGASEPIIVHFPELYPTIAAFSPDGSNIVTASHEQKDPVTGMTRYWATIWPTFRPITGPGDAHLWQSTKYCLPVAMRRELLGVTETLAREQFEKCSARISRASEIVSGLQPQE